MVIRPVLMPILGLFMALVGPTLLRWLGAK
jgi:hypothetical protein